MEFTDTQFLLYVGALVVSGIIMVVLALTGFGSAGTLDRVLNGLFGAGFIGYGVYLFVDQPDTFRIFFYAFIVPVIMIVRAFKARSAKADAPA
jgi:DMSO/TMAO reductase YedYZ heme-binding membrane subunit